MQKKNSGLLLGSRRNPSASQDGILTLKRSPVLRRLPRIRLSASSLSRRSVAVSMIAMPVHLCVNTNNLTRSLVSASHRVSSTAAITLATSSEVGGTTSGFLNRIFNVGCRRVFGAGFFAISSVACAQLKKPQIIDQWILRLLLVVVLYGSELR